MSRLSAWVQATDAPVIGTTGRAIFSRLRIRREFSVDRRAYLASSAWRKPSKQEAAHLQRDLTFWYHQVEKALTFSDTRRPFGASAETHLSALLNHPMVAHVDPVVRGAAEDALGALRNWNAGSGVSEVVAPLAQGATPIDYPEEFFGSRQSCRNFDPHFVIPDEQVRKIVRMAQSAPSVCNRQAARIHYLKDPEAVAAALALQSGNRGFGHSVTQLAIVTVDRRVFSEATERNQGWIDGGLFAMTLVWALHASGFASCMLNWSMGVTATNLLRRAVHLPEHEDVICMVAFGRAAPQSRRARSARVALSSVLEVH